MSTLCLLPPVILQTFSSSLLNTPIAKTYDDSETLEKFFIFSERVYKKKTKSGKIPGEKKKCEKLMKQFWDLYERIKIKEKIIKEKTNHKTKYALYSFGSIGKEGDDIFNRSRFRRGFCSVTKNFRTNN